MTDLSDLFPDTYEASRERFRGDLDRVRAFWPEARLESHPLSGTDEDLTIDWIQADALERQEKLLVITTGEHGIEAYVGSAMLQLFLEEFLSRLDPRTTGLLLVHAINPWGMKHRRRVNRGNVDLNRNFGWEPDAFNLSVNQDYDLLNPLVNPRQPLAHLRLARATFTLRLLLRALRMGVKRFQAATLLGQYRYPRGIYYGGDSPQEEVQVITTLYRTLLPAYDQFVLLDMHTGYGPSQPMTIVNSWMEPGSSKDFVDEFHYPRVVKSTPGEFYRIQGDMIDAIYALAQKEMAGKPFYAASFEFGTFGDSLSAGLRSLRAMVFENQVFWYGAKTPEDAAQVEQEYAELFAPSSDAWRTQAVDDARKAYEGVLGGRGYWVS